MSKPAQPDQYANDLVAALRARIPVEELAECAQRNLKATRLVRMNKENPDGVEEPEYATRQRALEWIGNQIAGAAPTRKPIEPPAVQQDDNAGSLRPVPKKANRQ
jgi:hypothetical protein